MAGEIRSYGFDVSIRKADREIGLTGQLKVEQNDAVKALRDNGFVVPPESASGE